jgi:hypothetical protein
MVTRLMAIVRKAETPTPSVPWTRCLNRVYGRPTEHVVTTVREPEKIESIASMSRHERRSLLRRLEEQGRLCGHLSHLSTFIRRGRSPDP